MTKDVAAQIASQLRLDPSQSVRSAAAAVGVRPGLVTALLRRVERQDARGERPSADEAIAYEIITEALEERHRLIREEIALHVVKGPDCDQGYVVWLRHLLETSDRPTHGPVSRTELVGDADAPVVVTDSIEIVEARVRARLGGTDASK